MDFHGDASDGVQDNDSDKIFFPWKFDSSRKISKQITVQQMFTKLKKNNLNVFILMYKQFPFFNELNDVWW